MEIRDKTKTHSIITNFKDAFKSLSNLKWLSTGSGFQISVAAGVVGGVAGLILALFTDTKLLTLSGPDSIDSPSEKELLVPGLQNLGNNCYFNSVLQALASCSNFQSFLKNVLEDCESSDLGEDSENFQLLVALTSLSKELCAHSEGRVVLNPWKVMDAMAQYVQNFNLTSQQDAEEAFVHLLTSLREECSDCCVPKKSSLAEAFTSPNHRILTPVMEIKKERDRWQQHYLGPFDGVLGSSLTCQSCSTEISLNLQFFHSLPLSPVVLRSSTIVGCMLEDCLKQFFVAEQIENYNCSHCWHVAAIKYLTLRRAEEVEIEKLRSCSREQDSCTCHNILPWLKSFSPVVKQLHIARCPKILCLHLLRVSVNEFGERIKLKGDINFPLMLDLHQFMLVGRLCQNETHHPYHVDSQIEKEVTALSRGASLKSSMYRLVSVIEHIGEAGEGHYRVYRSVRSMTDAVHLNEPIIRSPSQWFCISDSEVCSVSEGEVLAAEASLLFYEIEGETIFFPPLSA